MPLPSGHCELIIRGYVGGYIIYTLMITGCQLVYLFIGLFMLRSAGGHIYLAESG